jgi:hypothetical protein
VLRHQIRRLELDVMRKWTSAGWFDTELDRVITPQELEAERVGGSAPEAKSDSKSTRKSTPAAKKEGGSK